VLYDDIKKMVRHHLIFAIFITGAVFLLRAAKSYRQCHSTPHCNLTFTLIEVCFQETYSIDKVYKKRSMVDNPFLSWQHFTYSILPRI
jgi:hypothetical protein